MRTMATVLVAVLAASLPAVAVPAAFWQAIGPSGGGGAVVVTDPTAAATLYATSTTRIWKSVDGAKTWAAADTGIAPSAGLGAVTVDPSTPSTLYVVSQNGDVWTSIDGGAGWSRLSAAPAAVSTSVVTIDPAAHQTLFVGAAGQVWESLDGGATWNAVAGRLPANTTVVCLAIDPLQPARLYAGTGAGVYRSTDGGATWVAPRVALARQPVAALTVDPYREGLLWASPKVNGEFSLIASRDGGATWQQQLPATTFRADCLTVSPAAGHPLYACAGSATDGGLLVSTDSGRDWQPLGTGLPAGTILSSVAVAAGASQTLYVTPTAPFASSYNGASVFKSTDSGASWQAAGDGIYGQEVAGLAADLFQTGAVYAGTTSAGLFCTTDAGGAWENQNPGLRGTISTAVASDPLIGGIIYAATNRGFFVSDNYCRTWARRPGVGFPGTNQLTPDPRISGTLYGAGGFPLRTTDSGAIWTTLHTGLNDIQAIAVAPTQPTATLYAFATLAPPEGGGAPHLGTVLLISTDGGATFTQSRADLPGGFSAAAVDPINADTLYVSAGDPADGDFLYKSTDGGQTFTQVALAARFTALVVDHDDPVVVYGATDATPSDVLVSRDAGATWSQLAPGLPGAPVGQLAFGAPRYLYAGTAGASVYRVALSPLPP
jgi:photosystem II stability/assembly factor-like uncharacterized protein